MYVLSVVPAILIALNFESFRGYAIRTLQGGQTTTPVQQPAGAPQTQSTPIAAGEKSGEHGVRQPAIQSPTIPAKSHGMQFGQEQPPRRPDRVPAINARVTKPAQTVDYEVTLDLSRKRQRIPIDLRGSDMKLRILPLEGVRVASELRPSNGTFDAQHPASISFQTTNPARIKVSVKTATQDDSKSATIILDFSVESNTGRQLDFTTSNLDRIRNRITSQGLRAQSALADIEAEKRQLEAWVNSPGLKSLWEVKRGQARVVELHAAIPAATQVVSALQLQLEAVEELIELARSLDGAKLRIADMDAQK